MLIVGCENINSSLNTFQDAVGNSRFKPKYGNQTPDNQTEFDHQCKIPAIILNQTIIKIQIDEILQTQHVNNHPSR